MGNQDQDEVDAELGTSTGSARIAARRKRCRPNAQLTRSHKLQ